MGREVAARSVDLERLRGAFEYRESAWTVAEGDAGLALMCGQLDRCFPDQGWDVAAHRSLTAAVRAVETLPAAPPGLLTGVSGLLVVADTLARSGDRYARLLAALDAAVIAGSTAMVDAVRADGLGAPATHLDVVSGLRGIGAALLVRRDAPGVGAALTRVLDTIVALTTSMNGMPRRTLPPGLVPTASGPPRAGTIDLGLAHGIPGLLAVMALAHMEGVEVRGQRRALRATSDWIVARRLERFGCVAWPATVAVERPAGDPPDRAAWPPCRTAWCYGTPGVARALWLGGEALDDPALRSLAEEAMAGVHRIPPRRRGIESPTFCHGVAGLLQVTLRFAHDTGRCVFSEAATALAEQLLDAYEPERPFGYRAMVPGSGRVDCAGVLDGSAGVALVLLAAATDVEPGWDRLFMLS